MLDGLVVHFVVCLLITFGDMNSSLPRVCRRLSSRQRHLNAANLMLTWSLVLHSTKHCIPSIAAIQAALAKSQISFVSACRCTRLNNTPRAFIVWGMTLSKAAELHTIVISCAAPLIILLLCTPALVGVLCENSSSRLLIHVLAACF